MRLLLTATALGGLLHLTERAASDANAKGLSLEVYDVQLLKCEPHGGRHDLGDSCAMSDEQIVILADAWLAPIPVG